jgi:ABC-2 type transport system permease protein
MKKIWLVLRQEVINTLTRRSFQLVAFGLPMLSVLGFLAFFLINRTAPGAINSIFSAPQPEEGLAEGYIDRAGLIDSIPPEIPQGTLREYPDEGTAKAALSSGEINAYYLISEDYLASGEILLVQRNFNPFSILDDGALIQYVLQVNLLEGDSELAGLVAQPYDLSVSILSPTSERDEDNPLTFFLPYAVMMLYYVLILMSSGFLLSSLNKERENRVLEILMVTVTPRQLLAGKIVGLGLIGLLVNFMWVGTAYGLMQISGGTFQLPSAYQLPPSLLAWGLIYFLLGYAVYASLMGAVGALVPNLRESSQATAVVVIPLVIPLFFVSVLIDQPDSALAVALSLFPLTAPVTMMLRLAIVAVPPWQLAASVGLLALTAVWILRTVAGLFRAQLLLTGQKLTFKNVSRVVLGRSD